MGSFQFYFIFIFTGCLFLFSSCETPHAFYTMNHQDVNFFKEKKEVNISGGLNNGNFSKGFEIKGAVSLPKNIALSGGISSVKSVHGYDNSMNNGWRSFMASGAVGYYKPVKENFIAEGYMGTTFSTQKHSFAKETFDFLGNLVNSYPKGNADMSSTTFFIQQSIGYASKNFDAAFSLNYSYLNFTSVNNNISDHNYSFYNTIERISVNNSYSLLNPSIYLRAGSDIFKFYLKFDFTIPISTMDFPYNKNCVSLGLCFALTHRYDQ
jgi:hypothetical protein